MQIIASSTISHQPSFRNAGFSAVIAELSGPSQLITPDYSVIPPMDRRRMSEVLKMGIACTVDCLEQAEGQQPDAIIVGTSMGCCTHTRSFLDKVQDAQGGLISPTAFILSTHNTIAGQISLHLKNHGYNNTHTQNSLSFEQALIDALLCRQEGNRYVLVGAADEYEDAMYNMHVRLGLEDIRAGWGASFFMLDAEKQDRPGIELVDVGSYGLQDDLSPVIPEFLRANQRASAAIDLVLYSHSRPETVHLLTGIFGAEKMLDYQKLCGTWFTNSGFAMAYAVDVLQQGLHPIQKKTISSVLVCNNLVPENLGLILLERNI